MCLLDRLTMVGSANAHLHKKMELYSFAPYVAGRQGVPLRAMASRHCRSSTCCAAWMPAIRRCMLPADKSVEVLTLSRNGYHAACRMWAAA